MGDFQNGKYNLQIQHLEARDRGLYICELRRMSDRFRLKVVGMSVFFSFYFYGYCFDSACFKINAFDAVSFKLDNKVDDDSGTAKLFLLSPSL